MSLLVHARVWRFVVLSSAVIGVTVGVGCSDDPASSSPTPAPSSTNTAPPPTNTDGADASVPAEDASTKDSSVEEPDACADGGCVAPQGCALYPTAAFCDDFDNADALTPGKTKWDFVEPTDQPVATLSTAQKVSTPSSLLSRVIDGTTPGAKFAKTVTKLGFTQATWDYDVFLDNIGTTDGFFLDDFQFSDDPGPDTFGFRLVMFSSGGAIGNWRVEHNSNTIGGGNEIEPDIAPGTVTLGAWHHLKQVVKFTFAADAGAGTVDYSLYVDASATAAFQKTYDGPTRAQVAFARIAGMPLIFNKANSAGLSVYWDNHVLELQ
jgi:hypothetical protein